jgi:hypothetical protein
MFNLRFRNAEDHRQEINTFLLYRLRSHVLLHILESAKLTFRLVKREGAQQRPRQHHHGQPHLGQDPLAQYPAAASQSDLGAAAVLVGVALHVARTPRPKPESVWNEGGSLDGGVSVLVLVVVGF